MKQFLTIILTLSCVLSMSACGSSQKEAKQDTGDGASQTVEQSTDDSASYLGDWAYDTGKGNVITFHFNKGGTGYYEQSTKADTKWEYAWEIKDGVLVAIREAQGTKFTYVFEFNEDGTLTRTYEGEETGPYVRQ